MRIAALLLVLFRTMVSAQVMPPNATGVAMGHLHFHTEDPAAHVQFWTEVLGATPAKVGPLDVYKLPGVLIAITREKPTGEMESSTVPDVAMRVRDLAVVLAKAKGAGIRVEEQGPRRALLIGPDKIRVQLLADPGLTEPAANGRIRLVSPKPADMARWYTDVFGAAAIESGATLPGVQLEFGRAESPAGTKKRVLDHIGFEIKDLRAFTRDLATRGIKVELPYLKLPDLGIAIGFLTDPWGTYIELTEGLSRI